MRFVVDSVSEFSYFKNILLGLPQMLEKHPAVQAMQLKKQPPLTDAEIDQWEYENNISLPEDIRAFYASSNGYFFEYTYVFMDEDGDDAVEQTKVVGKVGLPPLNQVVRISGYKKAAEPAVYHNGDRYVIRLSQDSVVFLLDPLGGGTSVVLVYLSPTFAPTIWLITPDAEFYYLADDVRSYLKMAVVHLGIPNWQCAYTLQGVPAWSEKLFRLLAPHWLPLNKPLESVRNLREREREEDVNVVVNTLDSQLFKLLPRDFAPTANQVEDELSMSTPKIEPEISRTNKKKSKFTKFNIRR